MKAAVVFVVATLTATFFLSSTDDRTNYSLSDLEQLQSAKATISSNMKHASTLDTFKTEAILDTFKTEAILDTFKTEAILDTFKTEAILDTFKTEAILSSDGLI